MRLLADENFPYEAVAALRESGHDVLWIRTEAPGSSDSAILARAQAEERILITFERTLGSWPSVLGCWRRAALFCVFPPPRLSGRAEGSGKEDRAGLQAR